MDLGTLLILLLLLACPVGMLFMHRGGHASHGEGHGHTHGAEEPTGSLDELHRRRDELDAEIAQLERAETEAEAERKTPAAV